MAMAARRGVGERFIALRQRQEEALERFAAAARDESRHRMQTLWELSTDAKIEGNRLSTAMDSVQAKHDDLLIARRKRLAQLLESEHQQYETMLDKLVVTDEARREKLMQKARDLRAQRELVRQEEAERQQARRFRQETALLRGAESRIKVLHVADMRAQQVEENERRRELQAAEEALRVRQLEEQMQRQAERQQQDLENQYKRNQETTRALDIQVRDMQDQKMRARQTLAEDAIAFQRRAETELAAEKEAELQRKRLAFSTAKETKEQFREVRARRELEEQQRREEEVKELEAILKAKTEDERRELERKRQARLESVANMQAVERQMNSQAEDESELDRYWQMEGEREWQKREATWKAEQNRRDHLMAEVFTSRRGQVLANREADRRDLEQTELDRLEMKRTMEILCDDDEAIRARQFGAAKDAQAHQLSQMARHQAERDAAERAKRTEKTAAQAEESQYRAKINRELAKLEAAKPASYAHVPLYRPKRGLAGLQNGGF
jgi:hypothetical protein